MTQKEMLHLVPEKLAQIEKEYGVRVLYAAESGSRAWGTNSEHSDFDVRFIYIRPREDYLRLEQTRDVLEFPIADGWDMCGWDLSKTLRLLHNANSQIYEWFTSPVVYVDRGFSLRIDPVLNVYFSTGTAVYHYLHQADLKMKKAEKAEQPKVKQYLYALQHLGTARWVLGHHAPMPISFDLAVRQLPEELRQTAQVLLEQKKTRPQEPLLEHSAFPESRLQEERNRIQAELQQLPKEPEKGWEELNRFFLSELKRI